MSLIEYNNIKHSGEQGISRLVQQILETAIKQRASDIHIEAQSEQTLIRLRIDGDLQRASLLPKSLHATVIAKIKILANLDIAEQRLPQDGKFQFNQIDCRLSTCPTVHGEKAVIRLLNANQAALALDQLGLTKAQLTLLNQHIHQPQGLILVTGPTGSGKTFTLYSILKTLNQTDKNILTIEDPVEIDLPGVNQVNTHSKIGLSFAHTLRSFLRQDPDIIMVGEIRDFETADIALKAAQTGHLVLATLHTNSSIEAITRLRDMGIPNYLIAHTLSLAIAQRLIKKPDDDIGRTGVFELLPIHVQTRQLILTERYTQLTSALILPDQA